MSEDEKKELRRYFVLCTYRDGEYILQDEWEELEDIVKKNKYAQLLESARTKWILGKIPEQEFKKMCDYYNNEAILKLSKK